MQLHEQPAARHLDSDLGAIVKSGDPPEFERLPFILEVGTGGSKPSSWDQQCSSDHSIMPENKISDNLSIMSDMISCLTIDDD